MDVNLVNPFLNAFSIVLPQLGFGSVVKKNLSLKNQVFAQGVAVSIGLIGDVKGNVVYSFSMDYAREIASKMMMGMPVPEFDEMAQSAISELTNMLTANAAIEFSKIGKEVNISTPTLVTGKDINIKINTTKILLVEMDGDGIPIFINIGFED